MYRKIKKKYYFNLLFFPFLFLPLFIPFHLCDLYPLLVGCLYAAFLLADCYAFCFPVFIQSGFCFRGSKTYFAPKEESLVFSKPVVEFLFTYSVLRGLLTKCWVTNHQFLNLLFIVKSVFYSKIYARNDLHCYDSVNNNNFN